ncbi:MAG: hypothetical protein CL840_17435 [Crocinitomicaceae bacterium]|nr:hypothetical protein [Crocinitomicaceae bacterium]|tara:strand:- start:5638 stop:6564 length:927 start_codon:yes stop_codon:yes gene_type:complete
MKAKRNNNPVARPANINPNVWNVLRKVANEIWSKHDQGAAWNRTVLISCKEFYEMLLDENGQLILNKQELVRFSQNGHIRSWANELLLDGINLLSNKEYELAIKKLELHVSMNPGSALAFAKLGEASMALGNYRKALEFLNEATTIDNRQSEYFVLRASAYSHLDRDEKAMNDLSFAILLNNRNARAYASRASLYIAGGHTKLAISDLKKAVKLNPAEVEFKHLLVKAYQSAKRLPEAFKVLRSILKENPFDAEALFQCALVRLEFKVEEEIAEEELLFARSLGHPLAEKYLLDHFSPFNKLGMDKAA